MKDETQENTPVKTRIWLALVLSVTVLSYLLGFIISSKTGVEPGFFEQPEAGGYGATTEKKAVQGLDEELQDYYKDLIE